MRGFLALAVAVGLSACVSPGPSPTQQRSNVAIRPDMAGLQIDPIGKRIDFGRSPKGVLPALDRELGRHEVLSLDGCPASINRQLRWDDLVLTFTQERFVGWRNTSGQQGQVCV
ncbi:hypothetical protein K3556_00115 [Aliiroseovarius sp. M344]|uniref:hypothetical protein n=1 Tax=Aliiroseovarius sp. M344 TaxID=2867010 RepID=UPI0021AD5E06|nr:hypothetical protein [Aliiroseovarius sp. M344]UWQ14339.1 hypothetical protein K3556_00115 [Aliiroseovarius sp. M344]